MTDAGGAGVTRSVAEGNGTAVDAEFMTERA
jgi:hypothetical protein